MVRCTFNKDDKLYETNLYMTWPFLPLRLPPLPSSDGAGLLSPFPLYHFPPGTAASFPCLVAPASLGTGEEETVGAIIGSTSFEYISLTYHNPPLLRHPSFPSLRVKVLPLLRRGRGKTNLLTIKWFNIAYILHQCIMMNVIWIIFVVFSNNTLL